MSSILLILPYFGKWPVWFDAHLLSIEKNPTINWLIITDCEIPQVYPKNICFVKSTLSELNFKVNTVVGAKIPLTPRKLCDLRPAYGDIFQEYLKNYDFWGFCDIDIIWGDIRKFITKDVLNSNDIISSRKESISGHFSLFRNTFIFNNLYKKIPNYIQLFENEKLTRLDEEGFTQFIKQNTILYKLEGRIYWNSILLNQEKSKDSHQEYYLDKWQWREGKMFKLEKGEVVDEVMYLHFINWKKTMRFSEILCIDYPTQFFISYSSMHYTQHDFFCKIWNFAGNIFNGYYKKEWRRVFKKRFIKKVNRVTNKIKAVKK